MAQRLDPLTHLERQDKWYLGGGSSSCFAPPFPLHLQQLGFWDDAHFAEVPIPRLFTVFLLDETGQPIDLYVRAELIRSFNPVSSVSLTYRVMYSNEVTVPMFDDGQHGDGLAGDGAWGGVIPASAASPGQMIRYFVSGTDVRSNRTRFPAYLSVANSPQYQGTVVRDQSSA